MDLLLPIIPDTIVIPFNSIVISQTLELIRTFITSIHFY